MKNTKLISVLKSLSESEFKNFGRFLASPYFNRSSNVRKLFNIIKKYYPEFKADYIDDEKIYKKLFPGKEFNYVNFKRIILVLGNLAEEFLSIDVYRKDSYNYGLDLLDVLNDRKLDKIFSKRFEKMWNTYKKVENYDLAYFGRLNLIEVIEMQYFNIRLNEEKTRKPLTRVGNNYVLQFVIDILMIRIACICTKNLERNFEVELVNKIFESLDFDYFKIYMKKYFPKYYKIIEIFYYLYLFRKEGRFDEYYPLLRNSIKRNLHICSKNTQYIILFMFINCIYFGFYEYSYPDIRKDIFEMQKKIIKLDPFIYSPKKLMDTSVYRNTTLTALSLNEIDWAEKFINDNKTKLIEANRESIYNLMKAYISSHRKDYESILAHLLKVNCDRLHFKFDVRNLTLIAYYELGLYGCAYDSIRAYDKFLEENPQVQVSKMYKTVNKNFLFFYKAFLKMKGGFTRNNNQDIEIIIDKLRNTKLVHFKNWLMEKASELHKSDLKKILKTGS